MAYFIAHRGLSDKFPENTHAAFNAAWERNCDGIELDIQVTKDSQVVTIHDPDTQRTSNENVTIAEYTYEELAHINVGKGTKDYGKQFDERIPLLADVIANVPAGKIVQIEIKHHIENMDAVIEALTTLRNDIQVQIISFDPRKLVTVRECLPHLDCFLVMDAEEPPIKDRVGFALQNKLTGIDMDYAMAEPTFISDLRDKGLQIAHWTVNDIDIARRVISQGASFIASDIADEIKQQYINERLP